VSLLDRGRDAVTVYPQIETSDRDGNVILKASTIGIATLAAVQPAAQSGTSARRAELDAEGTNTEEVYLVRFPRGFDTSGLGPGAELDWNGDRWNFLGFPRNYTGSRRTAHQWFQVRRT
jgi:hypothetical protein